MITQFEPKCKTANPNKSYFDVLTLFDCVDNCVTKVNSSNGWILFGWLKPTDTSLEATNYDLDVHVVSVRPIKAADVEQVWIG